MTNATIEIEGRRIGPCQPTYIIAELSANHNQDYDQAVRLVHAAKKAGADAIKLQTFTAESLTIDCDAEHFHIRSDNPWKGQKLYQLYQKASMPWEWQPKLKKLADDLEIQCFSSPFDRAAVDFLEQMNVPAYKIASFELVDIPLIQYVAKKGKPIIMSTGLSFLSEMEDAVRAARQAGAQELVLLKCNSAYPAPPGQMNLRTIPHMADLFGLPVGLSDHTLGSAVATTAVALGACVIEKHFTLSRSTPSPDASFSMEPNEFKVMVNSIRTVEKALGRVSYEPTEKESLNRVFRRSLFVVRDIKAGERFTEQNVRSIRPGYGLAPRFLTDVVGKKASKPIPRGTPLTLSHIGGE